MVATKFATTRLCRSNGI